MACESHPRTYKLTSVQYCALNDLLTEIELHVIILHLIAKYLSSINQQQSTLWHSWNYQNPSLVAKVDSGLTTMYDVAPRVGILPQVHSLASKPMCCQLNFLLRKYLNFVNSNYRSHSPIYQWRSPQDTFYHLKPLFQSQCCACFPRWLTSG